MQVDDWLDREDGQRRRQQAQVAEVVVGTIAGAAAVVWKRKVEVRRPARAVVVATVALVTACVRAVISAAVGVIAVMQLAEIDRAGLSEDARVQMPATTGLQCDADGVPWRHADHHLREQEERKHEADAETAHGAFEDP